MIVGNTPNIDSIIKECLDASPDCFGILNPDKIIIYCNTSFAELHGFSKEKIVGKSLKELLRKTWLSAQGINIKTDDFDKWFNNFEELFNKKQLNKFETDLANNHWYRMTRMKLPSGFTMLFGIDITELKQTQQSLEDANEKIEHMANTDPLTGIKNRRAFDLYSVQEHKIATKNQHPFSILILDIDHFKKLMISTGMTEATLF